MKQEEVFLSSEADEWYKRNASNLLSKSKSEDRIYLAIKKHYPLEMQGKEVLEIGCANGYRLSWLKTDLGASIVGVEPSGLAVLDSRDRYKFSENEIRVDTARSFFVDNESKFDCIIFGHSLYLIDPEDYVEVIHGAMKALNPNGVICIYDFYSQPQSQGYHHKPGIQSYKMQFDKIFTWHPQFKLIYQEIETHNGASSLGNPKEDCALSVIKKVEVSFAFPKLEGDIEKNS